MGTLSITFLWYRGIRRIFSIDSLCMVQIVQQMEEGNYCLFEPTGEYHASIKYI